MTHFAEPQWTQEQAIAFEAARECIGHAMAIWSAELYEEEHRSRPDAARVAGLRQELHKMAADRASLRLHDDKRIAEVRSHYGALVRADREHRALRAA